MIIADCNAESGSFSARCDACYKGVCNNCKHTGFPYNMSSYCKDRGNRCPVCGTSNAYQACHGCQNPIRGSSGCFLNEGFVGSKCKNDVRDWTGSDADTRCANVRLVHNPGNRPSMKTQCIKFSTWFETEYVAGRPVTNYAPTPDRPDLRADFEKMSPCPTLQPHAYPVPVYLTM